MATTSTALSVDLLHTTMDPHSYPYSYSGGNSSNMTEDGEDDGYNVTTPAMTVHDMVYDFTVRVSILYVQIVLGTLGGILVMIWMLYNRRLRTRVNTLILNLCIADLLVMCLGCVCQLVWEYTDREWLAGDFMCRLMKFLMIFANCASTNMLVVIAIDRHQAIRSPLREPFAVSSPSIFIHSMSFHIKSVQISYVLYIAFSCVPCELNIAACHKPLYHTICHVM